VSEQEIRPEDELDEQDTEGHQYIGGRNIEPGDDKYESPDDGDDVEGHQWKGAGQAKGL
jgi:hypothetical protein